MSEQSRIARRTFFAGMGVAAAAATAASIAAKLTPKSPIQTVDQAPPEPPQSGGYRLTEHIKKYYRTTTI